jgi:uncharacterized repeat protein (TIGR01451 family)
MIVARAGATASRLADGRVLIAGGQSFGAAANTMELYDGNTRNFQLLSGTMSSPRQQHGAAVLKDGRVLIAGGSDGSSALASIDIYDPKTQTTQPAGRMSAPRQNHSVTTMLNGRVLIAGGSDGVAELASAEIFNPADGTIQSAGQMNSQRQGHLAIRLPNNNGILLVGGKAAGAPLASAEVYVPWTGTFQTIDSLSVGRSNAVAASVKKGGLLLAGGLSAKGITVTAETLSYATIATDKSDYAPGDTVTITGTGWQPGETVQIVIHEDPTVEPDVTLTAVADSAGNISNNQFQPDGGDVGTIFYVTATGLQSGLTAQTSFTDSTVFLGAPKFSATQSGTFTPQLTLAPGATGYVMTSLPGPPAVQGASCTTVDINYGPTYPPANLLVSGGPVSSGNQLILQFTVPSQVGTYDVKAVPGTGCSTNPAVAGSDTGILTIATTGPAISLTKAPNPATYTAAGQTITYTYTIMNTGDVTLTGPFSITDDHINNGAPFTCAASNAQLATGATLTCTSTYLITQADMTAGSVTNLATAKVTYNSSPVVSNQAAATVKEKAITLTKTANPTTYSAVGQTITYTYVITNSGQAGLPSAQYTISDDHIGSPLGMPFDCGAPTALAPGGTVTCTATYTISQADLDAGSVKNTATASGAGLTTPPASATITGTQTRTMSLTKTPSPTTYTKVGDKITYTYVITNTGNVTLKAPFTVTDDHITGAIACGSTDLAPGGTTTCTATYTITQADMDAGSVTNTANAAASDGTKAGPVQAKVTTTQTRTMSLTKTPNPTTYTQVGDKITYTYVITNTGNVTLKAPFTVTDDHITGAIACGSTDLAPGGTTTCTATYTITQADMDAGSVTNTANAAAGDGTKAGPVQAKVTTTQIKTNSLTKSANPTTYSAVGTVITYTYNITNTGNIDLAGPFSISDNKLGIISPCGTGPLAPGGSTSCTATYTITQADINAGSITNIATASGNGVTSNQATATVTAIVTGIPFTTYTQGGWGAKPAGGNPGAVLKANFAAVYGNAGVTIGGSYTLTFTGQPAVEKFLPQGGTPGVLNATAVDPTKSSANVFGGQVLALELSVDFSNKGITRGGLANLHVTSGPLAGSTVGQVLALANQVLGGSTSALPAGMTVSDLNNVVDNINNAFDGGTSSTGYVK